MTAPKVSESLKSGDPDRYLAAMAAPEPLRAKLLTLYAFNLEIARAPWASAEPMICEMRLQWWLDAMDKIYDHHVIDSHEILLPLARLIEDHTIPRALFTSMIETRQFDIYKEPHADSAAFRGYINATSNNLISIALHICDVPEPDHAGFQPLGFASGVANLLRATPALIHRGRNPLPVDIKAIIEECLQCLGNKHSKHALPAILPCWRSRCHVANRAKTPAKHQSRPIGGIPGVAAV